MSCVPLGRTVKSRGKGLDEESSRDLGPLMPSSIHLDQVIPNYEIFGVLVCLLFLTQASLSFHRYEFMF